MFGGFAFLLWWAPYRALLRFCFPLLVFPFWFSLFAFACNTSLSGRLVPPPPGMALPGAGSTWQAACVRLHRKPRHLWDLAKALQKAQQASPVDADYVVAIEAAVDVGGAHGFVNLVVVDRAGACVLADFQNDQHPTWKKHAPKGLVDAEKVAADRLRERLR